MKRFKLLTICILAFLFSQPIYSQSIKGYFPYYRSVAQANAVQYDKLTDVIYAFASLNTDGTLSIMTPSVFDAVQAKCAANGVKLHIAIGGWGLSGNFSGVAANATYRNNLANACLSLCQTKGLAGIDIDWEFPGSGDKANYTAMLAAIKAKLGSTYTLSAALGGEAAHTVGIEAAAFTYLDYFNIMTYDGPVGTYGNHTAVQFMKDAMEIYKNLGCPYSKMVPGSAFYGRCGGEETYAGISASNPSGFYNDADGIFNSWCYDSKPTLEAKIDYIMGTKGGSGIMIWELSQDRSDQYSLLSAVKTKMDAYSCSLATPDLTDASLCGAGTITLKAYGGTTPSGATYSWKKDGATITGSSNSLSVSSAGTYEVTVTSGCVKKKSAVVSASLPAVSLGSSKDLCNPASVTLDAGVSGSGINYTWTKNSTAISGASSQTYTVTSAGTYGVTVSAAGCTSKSSSVAITSSLVDINDVSRCGAGTVTMTINSPASGATYDWYTAATNGTKVNTGTSYSPNITGTTTYYIDKVTTGANCVGVNAYNSANNYPGGSVVSYNGNKYTSAYWANPGEAPGNIAGQWTNNGPCGGASCARTPVTATMTTGCSTAPIITFANISKIYGDASFAVAATSNSSGAITYSATGTGATITSAGVVTITGAGTVTITATQAAAGSYSSGTATATLTIAKKTLTITAENKSRAYNIANPTFTFTYSGFTGSDNATSLSTQPTATTTAVTASPAGNYPITPSGAASNNYAFNYVNGTLTVTAIAPTITFGNISKTYGDASFTATATSNSAGAITYSATGTGATITSAGVVTITGAGTVTITATQAANGNYNAGTATATLTIAKKSLTITADNKSRAYNTANPAFTFSYNGFAGSDNATSLTTQPSATTTATTASAAGNYPITSSGAASNNYTFTYVNGTLTVNAATAPTITFANISKTYGDASFSVTATSNSSGAITYSATGTGATVTSGGVVTITGAGTVTITATQAAAGSYSSGTATATLTISKKTLTITADNKSRAYNTTNPVFTFTYNGFAGSDNATSLTTQPSATTTATTTSAAGNYPITPTGAASNNYAFNYVNGTLTVTTVAPTITFANISKTYGDASFTVTATSNSSGAIAYSATGTGATVTSAGVVTITGAGTVTITATQAAAGSYAAGTKTATLTINKKALTITANNLTRAYNTANPTFTFSYNGFVGSDNATSLTTQPSATTTATTSSAAGNYPITPSGAASNNYAFTYVNGTLTINSASAPTISFASTISKTYGDASFGVTTTSNSTGAITYSATGTGATVTPAGIVTIIGAGTVTITASQAAAGSYSSGTAIATLTIAKKALTVTAVNKSRAYNTANPAFTFTYSGFVGSDNASGLSTQPSATTTAVVSSPTGNYTIIPSGAASNNYSFTYVNGTLTIVEAPLPSTQFTSPNAGLVNAVITLNTNSPSTGNVVYTVTSGTGTAIVSGNQLTLTGAGTVTVTATIAGDGNYAGGTASQTITITDQTTGIEDLTYVSDLKLYPVPATEQLTLGITLAKESNVKVELADTEGKTVSTTEQDLMIGTQELSIPVTHLANGIYIAKIYVDGQITIKKITVLK